MKSAALFALIVSLGLVALVSTTAFTEDEKPKPLSHAETEGKMMMLGSLCPQHKQLAYFVGTWTVKGSGYSQVMGEYSITGESVNTSMWDGRFISSTYEGPSPMGTLYGAGRIGYDRLADKFVHTWMMSMGTNIAYTSGTFDKEKKAYTFTGDMTVPGGATWTTRRVITVESADKHTETHHMGPKGGKQELSVKLTMTRKAAKPTTGTKK